MQVTCERKVVAGMVGTAGPVDPEKSPTLKEDKCFFSQIIGTNKPYSVRLTPRTVMPYFFLLISTASA